MLALLRRPAWAVGTLVAVVTVALFVRLGIWQLDRFAERRALNVRAAAGLVAPAAPLEDVLADAGDVEYRRVRARGTFDPRAEALLTPRARAGQPGFGVVTPLLLADGSALLVDRGWVPFALDTPPVAEAPPPTGEVDVTGFLRRTSSAARWSPRDGGPVRQTSAVDPDLLAPQIGADVVDAWYLAAQEGAAAGALPRPVEDPPLDEGPHRSYAAQWFLFAAVVATGLPVLLHRRARDAAH